MWLLHRALAGIFYPPRCVVCDGLLEPGDKIHSRCEKKLFRVGTDVCCRCGRPVSQREKEYCYDCGKGPHSFHQGKSLLLYQGAARKTMYRFKYANRREYAYFFAEEALFRHRAWMEECGIDLIVPIPMYRRKKRRRGYNQAEVFAKALAQSTGIPWEKRALLRVRDTAPQKELNRRERENNLKNAFQSDGNMVKYKRILLVDDIYTTGSTADAAAEALRKEGAGEVFFLSICIGKGT